MALSSQLLHERLRGAAKRFRLARAARFIMSGMAVALALLFVFLLADAQFHFNSAGRWTGFVLVLAPVLAGLAAAVRAALPAISEASMARRIEIVCGGAQNVLISAVQFDRELASQSVLRAALFEEMHDPFPKVNWSRVLDLELLRKLAWALLATAGILGLCAWIRPMIFANSAVRILLPASNIAPLTRTQFASITPGDIRIIHGKDLTIAAALSGEIPRVAWIYSRAPGGSWRKTLMDHEAGAPAFTYELKELTEPLEYSIEAGDASSPVYRITVRPRTVIRTRLAEVTLPPYALRALKGKGTSVLQDFAVLQNVLAGSRVAITLEFNNPVTQLSAHVPLEKGSQFKIEKLGENRWRFSGTVRASETVRLDYRDTDGLADNDSIQIAVKADDPPKILISEPLEGKQLIAAPSASVRIRFNATANFGLGSVALYRSTDEAADGQLLQNWKEAAGQKSLAKEAMIPMAPFAKEERVTFCVVAKDQNDVSGPGVAYSRPIVVTLRSAEELAQKADDSTTRLRSGLEALIKLQLTNLDASNAAAQNPGAAAWLRPLLDRQSQIAEEGRDLAGSTEAFAPATRAELQALSQNEMPAAVTALTKAAAASGREGRTQFLGEAVKLESAILARLQGASKSLETETARGRVQDLIAGLEDLLRKERDLLHETNFAKPSDGGSLSDRQDALAGDAARVREQLDKSSQNAAMGDDDFRARLTKAIAMFAEMRLYEEMLAAAEKLQANAFPAAAVTQKGVVANLAKIVELLNQWQLANANRESDSLKKAAHDMADKLAKLAATQHEVIEKSKELPRKGEVSPQDAATARQLKETKDEMAKAIEQMLTDAHIFPDLKPCNELRGELTQVYEDVIQTDKDLAAAGKLEGHEIAVQKEDSILQAIEQAKKIAEDIEMWLPDKNDTTKWQLENFDKTEMPDIPNLPLPDAFSDLVGDLLQEQKGLDEQTQDAASNQLMAQNEGNGWQVTDGPMGGFGAQGKSGNTRPKKNEQTGRSSGGREGESNGEMVGNTASNLEGTKPDARRTNDPMQQGHVKDNGSIGQTRATGGGKAGGFSDRNGMEGNAPLRPVNAAPIASTDALAVQQALLAEKTSRMNAQATLLYLKATGLPDVVRLMDQAQAALKEGRTQDFRALHQKIIARLNEVRGAVQPGNVVSFTTGDSARTYDKQLLGGDEGEAPPAYKQAVADYYRSLLDDK